jgi:hypothetical protein
VRAPSTPTRTTPTRTEPCLTLSIVPLSVMLIPVVILLGLASVFGATSATAQATVVGPGSGSVTVRVSISVPRTAFVRRIIPTTVTELPDGRREVAFTVVVTANCRWGMTVRPRTLVRASSVPPIEVRNYLGNWVSLAPENGAVRVAPDQAPCAADGVPVVLRMQSADHVALLSRVRFDVTPLE